MTTIDSKYLKQETVIIIAVVALVSGFFGGIVFSVFQSPSQAPQYAGSQPGGQAPGFTEQQASQILALEKEVAANPTNGAAWTQLGHVYFDTNQHGKAINAYTKSLELIPNNPNVLTDLGVMYRRNGQPDQAVEMFSKAASIDPNHEQSRFNKGVVLLYDLQDTEGAIVAWEDLLKANPVATAPNGQPMEEIIADLRKNS
jgi:cytochrome c-type biogenesis protein CcmH/NrfG